MAEIFISYAHDDIDFVNKLTDQLHRNGFSYWLDSEKLRAGRDWRTQIDNGIRSSFVVILIMSPEAKVSEYVTYEWAFAVGNEIPVIPLLIKAVQLHPRLEVLQYLDFIRLEVWDHLFKQIREYQDEYGLQSYINISLIRDSIENSEFVLDQHRKARKIPDYNTLTFLKNVFGWNEEIPEVNSKEIMKIRGEPIAAIDRWDRIRPRTIEETRRDSANQAFGGDWNYTSSGFSKIVFEVRNTTNQNIPILRIVYRNIHNSLADGDISKEYVRELNSPVIHGDIISNANSTILIEMKLTRLLSPDDIMRLRNKLGYLILDVQFDGGKTDVILSM
jgi:hypothetical protein